MIIGPHPQRPRTLVTESGELEFTATIDPLNEPANVDR